ncbi:hypothetical protein [Wenzhouxiangella sediminis]|uniref:Uncharacterized protein n=1 Tax=Wenzhouxiangella sediminis TaxID=1792836 RepID=A0A3E1K9T0_9GAMM|nr:hypothetical protein [Wenzhouxiangella sediminis]RFF30984.1 hypothetical protein DZC52_05990 [Wenzhouxiangella sediminis]
MKNRLHTPGLVLAALLALLLGGCATYYPANDRGVYYEVPEYRGSRVTYVDPLVYPYWSLDYFYYSRYYHPYSVVVHRWDPWYYPYPGWYYGYWPGPGYAGHRSRIHYPWYRYTDRYAGYRPWRSGIHLSFGYYDYDRRVTRDRVRELDARLDEVQTRRSQAIRDQRPDRRLLPGASPWLPATGRSAAYRRDELRRPPRPGPGTRAADGRSETQRRALIERLRTDDRDARMPQRSPRELPRRTEPPPTDYRDTGPRQRSAEPTPPVRQRPVEPSPPRSRPQRMPEREPARTPTRRRPPQRSDRRERR